MNRSQADTFICHASEDKEAIARPIHKALAEVGAYAWLDESEIRLGHSNPPEDRRGTRELQVGHSNLV